MNSTHALYWTLQVVLLSSLGLSNDPSEITVSVDTSSDVWVITIKNHDTHDLSYEMLKEYPRSLGIEFWFGGKGHEIYAGDNAELLTVFGNPADIRTIAPNESVVFKLDPSNVSAEDPESLKIWLRELGLQFYDMRIVFRDFASRRIWKAGPTLHTP